MSNAPFEPMANVDAYVDGLLSPEETAAFERELQISAELRRQVELHEQSVREVRSTYRYEPRAGAAATLETSVTPTAARDAVPALKLSGDQAIQRAMRSGGLLRMRRLAIAAVLVLGCAGVWATYVHLTSPGDKLVGPQEIYLALDRASWTPEEVCTEGPAFAKYVQTRMGQPLSITARPGVELVGWSYGDGYDGRIVGEKTVVMLARVDGRGVAVLIDRVSQDRTLSVPEGSGLRIFRRVVGSLVVYEVTPWEKPMILDALAAQ
ncbi:MAG: hypothetical protein K2W85_05885 [Phycisphaerales bacterium]|nr:hypothetical protein [Phycisphaerales bacterium]